MGLHTSAWIKSALQGGTNVTTRSFQTLAGIQDQLLGLRNDNLVPSSNLSLVAASAVGYNFVAGPPPVTTTLVSAQLTTPKTKISPVYVQPTNPRSDLSSKSKVFNSNPNVCWMGNNPVAMRADEEIQAAAWAVTDDVTGTCDTALVAWFSDRVEPVPAGDSYWVAFTASLTAVKGQTWNATTLSFQDQTTLPAGRYAVTGMQLYLASAPNTSILCGRLVVPNELMRPGALVLPDATSQTPPMSWDGSLGVWTRFSSQQPLSIEFLSYDDGAAVDFLGYLRVVQQER